MTLPKVVEELVTTQNNFDSVAYANCFAETAVVFDDGRTHHGRKEIQQWIAEANEQYKATMKPVSFEEKGKESLLQVEASGNFAGSLFTFKYHLEIADGLIQSLRITG